MNVVRGSCEESSPLYLIDNPSVCIITITITIPYSHPLPRVASSLSCPGRLADCGLATAAAGIVNNLTVAVLTVNPQWSGITVIRRSVLGLGGSYGGLISSIFTVCSVLVYVVGLCTLKRSERGSRDDGAAELEMSTMTVQA